MSSINRYSIQPQNSKIDFRINTPVGEVTAVFQEFAGHFIVSKSVESKETTSFDIRAGSLDAERKLICMMLRGEKFFDVENFPSINFVGSSFEWVDDNHAVLIGDMVIKNVERKVIFYVDLDNSESKTSENYSLERITITASANIRCSDFDLQKLSSVVSNTMSLNLKIEALKIDATAEVAQLD